MNRHKIVSVLFILIVLTITGCGTFHHSHTVKSSYKISTNTSDDGSSGLLCKANRKGYKDWPASGVVFFIIGSNDFRIRTSTDDKGIMSIKLNPGDYSVRIVLGNEEKIFEKIKILPGKVTVIRCEIPYGVEIQYE